MLQPDKKPGTFQVNRFWNPQERWVPDMAKERKEYVKPARSQWVDCGMVFGFMMIIMGLMTMLVGFIESFDQTDRVLITDSCVFYDHYQEGNILGINYLSAKNHTLEIRKDCRGLPECIKRNLDNLVETPALECFYYSDSGDKIYSDLALVPYHHTKKDNHDYWAILFWGSLVFFAGVVLFSVLFKYQ